MTEKKKTKQEEAFKRSPADQNRTDGSEEISKDPEFVRERILNQTEDRKKWVRRIGTLILSAVIFGTVAALVFAWLFPRAQNWFAPEEKETSVYHIPQDVPETEAETEGESEPVRETETESEGETLSAADQRAQFRNNVEEVIHSFSWDANDLSRISRGLSAVYEQAGSAVVTVTMRKGGTDWFDNPIETEGRASGVIWNKSDTELLILTSYQLGEDDNAVTVTFQNGDRAAGTVRSADSLNGFSIVSVQNASLNKEYLQTITPLPLGNSLLARAGQPVIMVGSPKEYVGSVAYGMITYVRSEVPKEDMMVRMIYTDISTGSDSSGVALNLSGEIIGIVSQTGENTSLIGISGLKSTMEKMSNGQKIARLGIIGQEVTEEISKEHEVPIGIYITESVLEGPAYEAGIQTGDVLTGFNRVAVSNMSVLQSLLEERRAGDAVILTVQRSGRDGYKELEIPVTLGSRR